MQFQTEVESPQPRFVKELQSHVITTRVGKLAGSKLDAAAGWLTPEQRMPTSPEKHKYCDLILITHINLPFFTFIDLDRLQHDFKNRIQFL
ncbi:MAG: hypothetical protein IPN96_19595 [Anaerolineales bacterium]|nr:hypothetical protein [Anaerolineales bacterium]